MSGTTVDRRRVLKVLSAAGIGSAVFGRALRAVAADAPRITDDMVRQASRIAGIPVDEEQRKMMLKGLNEADADYAKLRAIPIDNAVPPAFSFDPHLATGGPKTPRPAGRRAASPVKHVPGPGSEEDVAFASVETFVERKQRVAAACTAINRQTPMSYSAALVVCAGSSEADVVRRAAAIGREPADLRQNGAAGSAEETAASIRKYTDAGADRVYLQVLDLSDLDHVDFIANEVAPLLT